MEHSGRVKLLRKIRCFKCLEKLVYTTVFITLVGLLIAQSTKCVMKYVEGPTFTEMKIAKQQEAEFAAVTLCPQNNGYRADVLQVTTSRVLSIPNFAISFLPFVPFLCKSGSANFIERWSVFLQTRQ